MCVAPIRHPIEPLGELAHTARFIAVLGVLTLSVRSQPEQIEVPRRERGSRWDLRVSGFGPVVGRGVHSLLKGYEWLNLVWATKRGRQRRDHDLGVPPLPSC